MRCASQEGCNFFNYHQEDSVCCTSLGSPGNWAGPRILNPAPDGRITYSGRTKKDGDAEHKGYL